MEPREMKVTQQEMMDNRVPLHVRDYCVHILIPLNKCRKANFYSPFHCEHERHDYEICHYEEYERRRAIKNESKK